jgi:hypothetical protein
VKRLVVDGMEMKGNKIPVYGAGSRHEVVVELS